jgi:hypothetical protein
MDLGVLQACMRAWRTQGNWAACQLRACTLDVAALIQEGWALLPLLGDGIPDKAKRWEAGEVCASSLPLHGLTC